MATTIDVAVETIARLKDIEIARLQKELWYEKYNRASEQLSRWTEELKRREALSRGEGNAI